MSSRYNFEAERPTDVPVRSSPSQKDESWDIVENRKPAPWRHSDYEDITNRFEQPARVIRLTLESETAVEVTSTSITWLLNFHQIGPLRPGTTLTWRDIYMNAGPQTAGNAYELALSGFPGSTYSTNSTSPYTFRQMAVVRTGQPSVLELTGTCPLSVTLNGPIANQRVTLERLNNSGLAWSSNTPVRVGLMLVEPGARIM